MTACSVIIPYYTVSEYLAVSLESLCNQTYRDFEVLLISDGAPVEPESIAKPFRSRLSIIPIALPHAGAASTRNYGISITESKYLAFLDSDDFWAPTKLEAQIELVKSDSKLDGAYCNAHYVDENGNKLGKTQTQHLWVRKLESGKVGLSWLDHIITSSLLVKTRIVQEGSGFREDLEIAEDWAFLLEKPLILGALQLPLLYYRRHQKSIGKVSSRGIQDKLEVVYSYKKAHPEVSNTESGVGFSRVYFDASISFVAQRQWGGVFKWALKALWASPLDFAVRLFATVRRIYMLKVANGFKQKVPA